jgi:hypothetical protein
MGSRFGRQLPLRNLRKGALSYVYAGENTTAYLSFDGNNMTIDPLVSVTIGKEAVTLVIPNELLDDHEEHVISIRRLPPSGPTVITVVDGVSDDTFEQYRLNLLDAADK